MREAEATEALNRLADVSLVDFRTGVGESAWGLHDVLRLFVTAQPGHTDAAAAHLAWVRHHMTVHADPSDYAWFEQGVSEGLVAVERLLKQGDHAQASVGFVPLFTHLTQRGRYGIAVAIGEAVFAAQPDHSQAAPLWLGNLGICYRTLGEVPKAIEYHERALAIQTELGLRAGEASQLGNLGICYRTLGEVPKAIEFLERSLAIQTELGLRGGESNQLGNLGLCYRALGEVPKAIEYHERSLAIQIELGLRGGEANQLGNLGLCYQTLGEVPKAIESLERSLAIQTELGLRAGEASQLGNLGICYRTLGEVPKAIEYHERALAIQTELGLREGEANQLGNLGFLYADLGNIEAARRHLAGAVAIYTTLGFPDEHESVVQLREALDRLGSRGTSA